MPDTDREIIRQSLEKPDEPDTRPYPEQRLEWEDYAREQPIPDGVTITEQPHNDIYCELVEYEVEDKSSLILYLHGGGFVSGSCLTHRQLGAHLSKACGIPVLLAEYRLAPEHRFPAGLNDAVAVYRDLIKSDYQPSKIILAGDSAGGGLVASTLLKLRDEKTPLPKAGILISPWLDLMVTGESLATQRDNDPLITEPDLKYTARQYADESQLQDPLVSPLYADLQNLPPMLIHVGEHEILQSDSVRFAEKATSSGVDVTLKIWDEMWHVFHATAPDLTEANQALDEIGAYLKALL